MALFHPNKSVENSWIKSLDRQPIFGRRMPPALVNSPLMSKRAGPHKATGRPVGRPPITGEPLYEIKLCLPRGVLPVLDEAAAEKGTSRSAQARDIIWRWAKRRQRRNKKGE